MNVSDVEEGFTPGMLARSWRSLAAGEPMTMEGEHRRKDGATFPVEVRLSLFESGGRTLMLALARDITERREFERAREEGEKRFRQLFENSIDTVFIHDQEGRLVDSRSLGFVAVAEGVETEEQLIQLRDLGCDLVQGFHLSPPVPEEEIPALLERSF